MSPDRPVTMLKAQTARRPGSGNPNDYGYGTEHYNPELGSMSNDGGMTFLYAETESPWANHPNNIHIDGLGPATTDGIAYVYAETESPWANHPNNIHIDGLGPATTDGIAYVYAETAAQDDD